MNENPNFKFQLNYFKNNKEKINQELVKSIEYLNKLDHPSQIFDENSFGYSAIVYIGKILYHFEDEINFNLFTSNIFEVFLSYLLGYLYEINSELNFGLKIDTANAEDIIKLNEKYIVVFIYTLYLANIITSRSNEFSVQFLLHDGLKAYLLFLNDDAFINKNKNVKIRDIAKNPLGLFDYITLNVSSLCTRTCDEHKAIWINLASVNILLKIAKVVESTAFDAYLIIALVINDEQIENFPAEISSIVDKIVKLLLKSSTDLTLRQFDRLKYQILFKEKTLIVQTQSVEYKKSLCISVIELFQCLYKLSLNEMIKLEIYFKHDILNILKIFLSKGNYFEINYSLELLAQLSFNEKISKDLNKNYDMLTTLNDLNKKMTKDLELSSENDKDIFHNIKSLLEQINWNLRTKNVNLKSELVVISYELSSREVCVKIKEKLELNGYKVWMDTSNISNYNLETNLNAIENSLCFLMCITEKYRQSINCQIEARYAFKLNKKIIPILLQAGCENLKGWLELFMFDKVFIDVTTLDLEGQIQRLKNELSPVLIKEMTKEPTAISTFFMTATNTLIRDETINEFYTVEEWDENQVKDWFVKNKLEQIIFEYLKPCNGKMLKQMFQMKLNAPEFFYHALKEIEGLKFNALVLFSSCLDELFNSKK